MRYNAEVFTKQFPRVKTFVYHLTYYRELSRSYSTLQLKSVFWTCTIDAHLLQATIQWCMVFGSHGCNPIHWKRLSQSKSKALEDNFRQGLLPHIGMTATQWQEYWKEMNDFRNKYAAHRELIYNDPVPDFTVALQVAYYYDKWIRRIIAPDIFEEPPLEQASEMLKRTVAPLVDQLIEYTKRYKEHTESDTAHELL